MQQYLVSDETPDNLSDFFQAFSARPWALLLDSAAAVSAYSRYDILLADPVATLETVNGITIWQDAQGKKQTATNPFNALQKALKSYFPKPFHSSLPFTGGAAGYFSYDLGRTTEKLPVIAEADINLPEMAIGLYSWALILDKQQKQLWYVDYYGQAETGWLALRQQYLRQHKPLPFTLSSNWQANMSFTEYAAKFQRIQHYLHSGDCYQINLTQRFSAAYSGDEWQAYLQLRQQNAAPFSAFMRLPQAAVISISPERFIRLTDKAVETKPIKGTRPRYADPVQDKQSALALQHSEKDRAENVMIVDLLRNDLGKVCQTGTVSVPHLFEIESFPAVHHLVSTVTGTLDNQYDACELLRAVFPGGSITGAPKVRAMQIIEELEPQRRSVYCGAIGYISSNGNMDTNIAIRTLICHKQRVHCWAGGGIVADSEVGSEYQETLDKLHKILPVLAPKDS